MPHSKIARPRQLLLQPHERRPRIGQQLRLPRFVIDARALGTATLVITQTRNPDRRQIVRERVEYIEPLALDVLVAIDRPAAM